MKTTVIIPAYNEEQRISAVIDAVKKCPLANEIIVVDDGSKDNTAQVAKNSDAKVIKLEKNLGKGGAMQQGIEHVGDADLIAFIDADLIGLTSEHLCKMIQPLVDDPELQMSVGKFVGGRARTDLAQQLVPQISGQRVLRYQLLKTFPDLTHTKFGVELAISNHVKKSGFKALDVPLENVTQVMKEEKLGLRKGFIARIGMYKDMFSYLLGIKKH